MLTADAAIMRYCPFALAKLQWGRGLLTADARIASTSLILMPGFNGAAVC